MPPLRSFVVNAAGCVLSGADWAGRIHRLAKTPSTMDAARALAEAGAPHGTAVMADVQSAGRGRGGRVWASPAGNLHATILLRPDCLAARAPELGFVTAIAAAAAVDALTPGSGMAATLKWPNDVLWGGAKLAGLLMERLENGAVLAGIGLNVRHHPEGMPYPTTSLAAAGCEAGPEAVLKAVMAQLHAGVCGWRESGFAPVLRQWLARGPAPGTALQVRLGEAVIAGRFAGLSPAGALRLHTAEGLRELVAGDILAERAGTRP